MRLDVAARLARSAYRAGRAAHAREFDTVQDRLLRGALPALADGVFGRGAGALTRVGVDAGGAVLPGVLGARQGVTGDGCPWCAPFDKPRRKAETVDYIDHLRGSLLFVLGRRGTGKTAISVRIAERWGAETFVLGIKPRFLPAGWHSLDKYAAKQKDHEWLQGFPAGATFLVDDAGVFLDSQDGHTTTGKGFRHLVMVVRHDAVNIIVNTQYSAATSKYALDADVLLLKPPPRFAENIERDGPLQALYKETAKFWGRIPRGERARHVWAICEDTDYAGPLHVALPDCWSEQLSTNKQRRAA